MRLLRSSFAFGATLWALVNTSPASASVIAPRDGSSSSQAGSDPVVKLGQTSVIGQKISTLGQEFFGGIPYAEPPVGNLRFQPPVPKFSLNESSINATTYGSACPQAGAKNSEDCLTINILRPENTPADAALPVMVWLYGGGFYMGNSSTYNASGIVAQSVSRGTPIIYVNFNYRLGPLGFPQGAEAVSRNALNFGLKDMLVAFEWVQRNIGAFGGDPLKVTAFGESAGSIALGILTLNPSFEKLARAVIFESGTAASTPVFNGSHREAIWSTFVSAVPECANATGGNTFSCLQTANASHIAEAGDVALKSSLEVSVFAPVLDGPDGVFPALPSEVWRKGSFAKLPFIAGTNKDEGTYFANTSITTESQLYEKLLQWTQPTDPSTPPSPQLNQTISTILQLYPNDPSLGSPFGTGNETFGLSPIFKQEAAILGDLSMHATRRAWIMAASQAGVKTWGYLFTDNPPGKGALRAPFMGSTHSLEFFYLYGFSTVIPAANGSLAHNMVDYWVSFATSLNPNDKHGNTSRPSWGAYTPTNQKLLQLNTNDTKMIQDDFRAQQIAFLNSDPKILRH